MGAENWKITTYSIVNDKLKINNYSNYITFKADVGYETCSRQC